MGVIIIYSNDYGQIKNGLSNYVGSLLKACPFQGKNASRQHVAAALIEEALNLMKNEDNSIELYVAKPLLRGTNIVLQSRIKEISALPKTESILKIVKDYEDSAGTINKLINNIE